MPPFAGMVAKTREQNTQHNHMPNMWLCRRKKMAYKIVEIPDEEIMNIKFNTDTDYLEIGASAKVALMKAKLLPASTWGNPWTGEGSRWREFILAVKNDLTQVEFKKTGYLINGCLPQYKSEDGVWEYSTNGQSRRWKSCVTRTTFVGSSDDIINLWHKLMP